MKDGIRTITWSELLFCPKSTDSISCPLDPEADKKLRKLMEIRSLTFKLESFKYNNQEVLSQ